MIMGGSNNLRLCHARWKIEVVSSCVHYYAWDDLFKKNEMGPRAVFLLFLNNILFVKQIGTLVPKTLHCFLRAVKNIHFQELKLCNWFFSFYCTGI